MGRFYFLFLLYSLVIYFLGVIFARKVSFAQNFNSEVIKEYFDYIYLAGALGFLLFLIIKLWPLTNDDSQLLIFSVTAMTLFFQGVIGDRPYRYRNRPKIRVHFDINETENYHMTIMQNNWETYSGNLRGFIPTYYVRLRVENYGNTTLKNAQVVLRKVKKGKLKRPFFPLNLTWAFAGEMIDIPPKGASKTVDIIEVMEPYKMAEMLADFETKGSGPDKERYLALWTGFRTCSIRPNSLSDIFEKGGYVFEILVTAENANPEIAELSVKYDGDWKKDFDINEMKSKHLKVKLLS